MKVSTLIKRPAIIMMLGGAFLNVTLWLLAIFMFPQHDVAVLHYSVDVGIDFIGAGRQIIVLPAIGLLVLIGNNLLGLAIYRTDNSSAWLAWSSATIIQLILISAFFLIWQANV